MRRRIHPHWAQQAGGRAVAILLALAALASCNRAQPVETAEIFIRGRNFDPAYVQVDRGPAVWWVNETEEQHVVSFEGFESVQIDVYPGQRRGFAFTESREYRTYCKIHNFKGRVLIVEPEA